MTLNESIAEYVALEWSGELGCYVGNGPKLQSGEQNVETEGKFYGK